MASSVVEIPIYGSADETVELDLSELTDGVQDIINVLAQEKARLALWLQVALYYYSQRKASDFAEILETALKGKDDVVQDDVAEHKNSLMRIYTYLAAYNMQVATQTRDKGSRKDLFAKATQLYNLSDRINVYDPKSLVGKGFLDVLNKGNQNFTRALRNFSYVLASDAGNIQALLGKACVEFNQGKFQEALDSYRAVLRINPECPPSVRVGIGMCLAKLKRFRKAQQAFERVLDLDPRNQHALIALAIFQLNDDSDNKNEAVKRGIHMLSQAHESDPTNSLVLTHLANHFFFRQKYDVAENLSLHALDGCEIEEMQAEGYLSLARIYHAKEEYDRAFQHYFQAARLAPDHSLAQFGLGQMYLYKRDKVKARECFEKALALQADNYETLKILGSLSSQSKTEASLVKAQAYLKKVVELHPDDVEAWLEYAALLERNAPQEAITAYNKAVAIIESIPSAVPPEVANNTACLLHRLGKYAEAESKFDTALALCRDLSKDAEGADAAYYPGLQVSITYNKARLYEDMRRIDEASALHKTIVEEHPHYIHSCLRLGCIARDRGLVRDASNWYKRALAASPNDVDAWALLGNLHTAKREWQPAQTVFERVLSVKATSQDPYVLLSMGNLYLHTTSTRGAEKDKAEASLKRALEFFDKVLAVDPTNIYAANGIGCVMALRGNPQDAKDIFIKVREAAGNNSDTVDSWINLAHCYVEQSQFENAAKLYAKCPRFPSVISSNRDSAVLTFTARAYFKHGNFLAAMAALQKALHINPRDETLRFNIALCQLRYASTQLRRQDHTLKDVESAVTALEDAKRAFVYLSKLTEGKLKFEPKAAAVQAQVCDDTHRQATQLRGNAARREAERQEQMQRVEQQRRDILNRKQTEKEEKEQQAQKEESERQRRTEQYLSDVQSKGLYNFEVAAVEKKRKTDGESGRKRKKKGDFIDEEMEEDEDVGPAPMMDDETFESRRPKSKKSSKSSKRSAEADNDEEEEEEEEDEAGAEAANAGEAATEEDAAELAARRREELEKLRKETAKRKAKVAEAKTKKKRLNREDDENTDEDDDFFASRETATAKSHGKKSTLSNEFVNSSDDDDDAPARKNDENGDSGSPAAAAATKKSAKRVFDDDDSS
eukprot:m.115644 g.115644  ORF g.115644 m.115644 type:complete len:1126 (+) comp16057_c0_seq1:214-3591(+)